MYGSVLVSASRRRARVTARRRFALGDRAAIGTSMLCLVHCLAVPLMAALFASIARIAEMAEWFHFALVLLALPTSCWAMTEGFRRHGAILPVVWAISGLILLVVGALGGWSLAAETGITVIGSIILMLAHVLNWRARLATHQ